MQTVISLALIIALTLFIIVILSGIDDMLLKGHFVRKLRKHFGVEE